MILSMSPRARRWFLRSLFYGVPALAVADAAWWEPRWLRVRTIRLGAAVPKTRFVHFTDLHFKGDRRLLEKVVGRINALSPEFVVFTGDIVEDSVHLPAALGLLGGIRAPLFGVPGNHDYWAHADFGAIGKTFAATGGGWLVDETAGAAKGRVQITGASCATHDLPALKPSTSAWNLLLMHYPAWVAKIVDVKFDLMLAGHSHGGQVRLPFVGPLVVPFGVDQYDLGLFTTRAGPLYVNPGIGWFYLPLRFRCRPELTVFEV